MPSARNSHDSDIRLYRLPKRQNTGVTWPLLKAAILCFLLGLAVSRSAWIVGISPLPFALLATLGFVVCVVTVWLGVVLIDGVSARLCATVIACVFFGLVMLLTLRQPNNRFVDAFVGIFGSVQEGADRATVLVDQAFKTMLSDQHLAAASDLIFLKGTQVALNQARLHLRSIPPMAQEYKSAQALLQVAETRLNELEIQSGQRQTKIPIQIIARDRTDDRLRVTFRNVGQKTVKRFRYSISFFRVTDGWHVEPDKQSEIDDPLAPWQTRTIEISDEVLTGRAFNASLAVVGWEVVPTS
jgi:hypothetical protein